MKYYILALCICLFGISPLNAQTSSKEYLIRTVAFYNLENLFDTIDDPVKYDESSPIMEYKGNRSQVYWDKIGKLSDVLSKIGKEKSKTAPAIIGICEAENRTVLEDLVQSETLKKYNYGIVHYESPDQRGIDVALLYQKKFFNPIFHEVYNPNIFRENRKVYTRDQLLVSGYLDGELIHIIVNHWPSRSGGTFKSSPLREKAAFQNKRIIEELQSNEKQAKILIMGDFNDDPINTSLKKVLETKANRRDLDANDIYNPFEELYKNGQHTLVHNDHLNLFDMIMLSAPLVKTKYSDYTSYKLYQARVFDAPFLKDKKGRYIGYPFRSFSNGNYTGGYSDHFPVYMHLIRLKNK